MPRWRPRRRYRGRDRFDTPPDPSERFGDDPYDADPFDEDDDPDDFDASPSFVRRAAPHGRLTWRQHFAIVETTMRSARPPAPAWDPSREIVYVVDIPRSSAGAGLLVEFLTRERGQERAPRGTHLRVADIAELPDAEDRRALTLFAAMADAGAPGVATTASSTACRNGRTSRPLRMSSCQDSSPPVGVSPARPMARSCRSCGTASRRGDS